MSTESQYTDIRAALATQLSTMTGVPDVAWENKAYTPTGVPYLMPIVMWADSEVAEIGLSGSNRESGVYQITCVYPTNAGTGDLNTMLGKLRDRFKRGTKLVYNGITVTIRKCSLNPCTIDATGIRQPISVSFFTTISN